MTDPTTRRASPLAADRSLPLFRLGGIQVRLEASWFLIFALVLISLSAGYFPGTAPGLGPSSYWTAGLLATLLLFASVLLHEFAHSVVALRNGIPVPEIRLFLFGGVSRMAQEPQSAPVELRVAIAGPALSFALAALFWAVGRVDDGAPWMVPQIVDYLAWINLALGVFNLLPGFPLDGGRVLRALVWWRTGSLRKGTEIAAGAGRGLAIGLGLLGGLQILAGALIGGIWMILIALLVNGLAKQGLRHVVLRSALSEATVADAMVPRDELVTVGPDTTLDELVHDWFLVHGMRGAPVVEDGRLLGLVTADDVRRVERGAWGGRTVRDVFQPASDAATAAPDERLLDALQRLEGGRSRLLVARDGDLVGLLTASRVGRFVELSTLADGSGDAGDGSS